MDKREQVINAARVLFSKYGYKKVSMDEIAKESGVTKKTIYTYFKDKTSLFKFFISEELAEMKLQIENSRAKGKSLLDITSTSILQILTLRKNSELLKNVAKDAANDAKARDFLGIFDNSIISYIQSILEDGIQSGEIRNCDTKLTAFLIYKLSAAVLIDYNEEINEERVVKEITTILHKGILN